MQTYMDTRVYRFLNKCGKERTPYNLCCTIAIEAERLIPYDQARVIFIDEKGKITSSMLYGVKQQNWRRFMDYYETEPYGSNYSLKTPIRLTPNECVKLCDWTNPNRQDGFEHFVKSYVRPLKLKYCLGIGLSDNQDCLRCILSLDRTRDVPYEQEDIDLIKYLHPLINHLHINLFTPPQNFSQKDFLLNQPVLTQREWEIANLIIKGVSTTDISTRLCISKNTIYKHIANMYKKLNVSNKAAFIHLLHQKMED